MRPDLHRAPRLRPETAPAPSAQTAAPGRHWRASGWTPPSKTRSLTPSTAAKGDDLHSSGPGYLCRLCSELTCYYLRLERIWVHRKGKPHFENGGKQHENQDEQQDRSQGRHLPAPHRHHPGEPRNAADAQQRHDPHLRRPHPGRGGTSTTPTGAATTGPPTASPPPTTPARAEWSWSASPRTPSRTTATPLPGRWLTKPKLDTPQHQPSGAAARYWLAAGQVIFYAIWR